jgi:hypothetical protein
VLLAAGWPLEQLGLAGLALLAALPLAWLLGGWAADRITAGVARRRDGRREPEHLLGSVALPVLLAAAGALLYARGGAVSGVEGGGGGAAVAGALVVLGSALVVLGAVTCSTVLCVYVVECYPSIAG